MARLDMVLVMGSAGSADEEVGGVARMASRFQFARPAVDCSLLLQVMWIPPVDAARAATWPLPIVASSSSRKADARACFSVSNSLLRSRATLSFFEGDLVGLLRVEADGDGGDSSSSCRANRRFVLGGFLGEYWSFQSLMTAALQKASMLGR